jgi:hypothetical protein
VGEGALTSEGEEDSMTRQEIIEKLTDLRRTIEEEAGASLDQVEVPIYWVLLDVCSWLGLSEEERLSVLEC